MAKKKKSKEELDFEKNFTEEERLKIENEILKLKIETELGAELQQMQAMDIPIELENVFLNQIYNFHQKMLLAKKVSIYNYIGSPDYILPLEIHTKKEFTRELKRLIRYMRRHGIEFDIVGKQTHEVLYHFLINELFVFEIDDIKTKGSKFLFHYEDFHPNIPLILENLCFELAEVLFSEKEFDEFLKNILGDSIWLNGKEYTKELFIEYIYSIKEFLPEFDTPIESENNIVEIKNTMDVEVGLQFKDGIARTMLVGFIQFEKTWRISKIEMAILQSK